MVNSTKLFRLLSDGAELFNYIIGQKDAEFPR